MESNQNPYASPVDVAFTDMATQRMQLASRGKRIANLIIDNIVVQVVGSVVGFGFGIFFVLTFGEQGAISLEQEATVTYVGYAIGILVALAYFILTEANGQKTFAKLITKTKVVTVNGETPTFKQVVGRSFARFIPFEMFSFLTDNPPVGWHDSLSGTRVIDCSVG
jgi:uncharacterized RDD family membrane protein YckC